MKDVLVFAGKLFVFVVAAKVLVDPNITASGTIESIKKQCKKMSNS